MSGSQKFGGLGGGFFALFDGIGTVFFTILIGYRRASRNQLRGTRVIVGSILFCTALSAGLFIWNISWFKDRTEFVALTLLAGFVAGLALGGILVLYVAGIEEEERQEEARQRRREERIAKGLDPDGGCFVATFAFDGEDREEVIQLRNWRDRVLVKSVTGLALIRAYETLSPHLVELLAPCRSIKKPIRFLLRIFLRFVRFK